ncbi:MAG: hypothetical protein WCC90_06440 [Methylocella sp.]
MTTTLHYSIVNFFETRMANHNRVQRYTRISVADEYIYKIDRSAGLKSVNVFLSDAYRYGYADYLARPKHIRRGDFILIVRPEAGFDEAITERARKDGIGIGKIGKFMGALNTPAMCNYISPEERKQNGR